MSMTLRKLGLITVLATLSSTSFAGSYHNTHDTDESQRGYGSVLENIKDFLEDRKSDKNDSKKDDQKESNKDKSKLDDYAKMDREDDKDKRGEGHKGEGDYCYDDGHNPTDPKDPTNPVPVPAAFWLFGSGMAGLIAVRRRKS